VTEQKNKPVLDEHAFGKLLEASYVIQEHNRRMRDLETIMSAERLRDQESVSQAAPPKTNAEENAGRSNGDYTLTLAEIVEAQRQIQAKNLDLEKAMAVVAESVARITRANGAAIGILDEKIMRYRAGAGAPALPVGSEMPLKLAVCAASVRTGQVIRSEDVNTEVLFDPEPCRQRGIRSLVAVPIYQDGGIVGGLELYFDKIHGYAEQDIHTCQLMAGLVTEALGRDADIALKKSMAAERSNMLATIQRLQPNSATSAKDEAIALTARQGSAAAAQFSCGKCAAPMLADEQFCGHCGASRNGAESSHFQDEPLPPPYDAGRDAVHQAPANEPFSGYAKADAGDDLFSPVTVPAPEENEAFASQSFPADAHAEASAFLSTASAIDKHDEQIEEQAREKEDVVSDTTALVKSQPDQTEAQEEIVWSSAAKARDFLESLSDEGANNAFARFWHFRRGDFYLALALVLVACVILYGFWSNRQTVAGASGASISANANRRKPAPDANLSMFDKFLISVGVADPPDAPEYKGNPDVQVWVDLHTALYYCPGSDLYGKTPKGKLATQRDAQLDQFEPAYRKACD
jgi:putative methionine-R-sulfoxide reductase with GAF domain